MGVQDAMKTIAQTTICGTGSLRYMHGSTKINAIWEIMQDLERCCLQRFITHCVIVKNT